MKEGKTRGEPYWLMLNEGVTIMMKDFVSESLRKVLLQSLLTIRKLTFKLCMAGRMAVSPGRYFIYFINGVQN